MQNAKDTFYEVLQGRLAAINPERTVVLRGVTRPGVEVVENEMVNAFSLPDCFRVEWGAVSIESEGAMPVVAMECVVGYETAGTALNAGMDRGRALAAMDGELLAAVNTCPHNTVKMNYSGLEQGKAASAMGTSVWWGPVSFGKQVLKKDRVGRVASVMVMSYQEAGEL
ncbi:hypothetical protein SAMN05421819_2158 [Bryocella elongata]|uniref:Uncharacterized protein n=1 Tax=Bryocella elongata TaxID=863522 RepID=A0A1H5Y7F2_9BACT|nr:hypothetical protein [Bryocella elongata]SEG19868.1 hypothetical protein SAMN05421819_2158 [Bryocella elongata]